MKEGNLSKHTPGPWMIHDIDKELVTDGKRRIASTCEAITIGSIREYGRKTREANATLIAAAPELYIALNELLAHVHKLSKWIPQELETKCVHALIKAEGGA